MGGKGMRSSGYILFRCCKDRNRAFKKLFCWFSPLISPNFNLHVTGLDFSEKRTRSRPSTKMVFLLNVLSFPVLLLNTGIFVIEKSSKLQLSRFTHTRIRTWPYTHPTPSITHTFNLHPTSIHVKNDNFLSFLYSIFVCQMQCINNI